jgi:hypothetical protein
MFCTRCGTEHPETANFCMNCGTPFRGAAAVAPAPTPRPTQFEFRDLTIPLEASSRVFLEYPEEARQRFREFMKEHLDREAGEGWEPAEPTDFDSLKAAGRIEEMRHRRFGHLTVYNSVTVRLKRTAPA